MIPSLIFTFPLPCLYPANFAFVPRLFSSCSPGREPWELNFKISWKLASALYSLLSASCIHSLIGLDKIPPRLSCCSQIGPRWFPMNGLLAALKFCYQPSTCSITFLCFLLGRCWYWVGIVVTPYSVLYWGGFLGMSRQVVWLCVSMGFWFCHLVTLVFCGDLGINCHCLIIPHIRH